MKPERSGGFGPGLAEGQGELGLGGFEKNMIALLRNFGDFQGSCGNILVLRIQDLHALVFFGGSLQGGSSRSHLNQQRNQRSRIKNPAISLHLPVPFGGQERERFESHPLLSLFIQVQRHFAVGAALHVGFLFVPAFGGLLLSAGAALEEGPGDHASENQAR